MLNINNNKFQLNNWVVDGIKSYICMHFINNPLYNYFSMNDKLDEEATKARNCTMK